MPESLADAIAARARQRFVRWDHPLWEQVVAGPAQTLAERLHAAGHGEAAGRPVLESYLSLAAEGIGLGYLFPTSAVGASFLTMAWTRLVPEHLAALPRDRMAATLAECWNLGENLEKGPVWLRRVFMRVCETRASLDDLPALVAQVSKEAMEEPATPLGPRPRIEWVALAAEDARFLPGSIHFVAPTVVCVHDRHRTAVGERAAPSVGAWLTTPPLVLGPMGCTEEPARDTRPDIAILEDVESRDPRAADWLSMARNDWRAAVTLETSQFLVALLPS